MYTEFEEKSDRSYNQDSRGVLLFTEYCKYTKALKSFCEEKRIPYFEIKKADCWARDWLFENSNNIYIRNNLKYHGFFSQEKLLRPEKYQLGDNDTYLLSFDPQNNIDLKRHIDNIPLAEGTYLHSTNRCLEGGNLFVAKNLKGEKCIIIGERVIAFEQLLLQQKQNTPYLPDSSNIIARYMKIFNTNNIIIVPNICYHIDLQMAYVGRGTFLIHSFEETKKHFPNEAQPYFTRKRKKLNAISAAAAIEEQVNIIAQKLRSANFKVIKFCGNLYNNQGMNIFHGKGLKSTFVNGIDIYSSYENKYYFITIDSPIDKHKKYFENLMRDLNITPYFVTDNDGYIRGTLIDISEFGGAIRCQTNFIDADKVNWKSVRTNYNLDDCQSKETTRQIIQPFMCRLSDLYLENYINAFEKLIHGVTVELINNSFSSFSISQKKADDIAERIKKNIDQFVPILPKLISIKNILVPIEKVILGLCTHRESAHNKTDELTWAAQQLIATIKSCAPETDLFFAPNSPPQDPYTPFQQYNPSPEPIVHKCMFCDRAFADENTLKQHEFDECDKNWFC